MHNMKPNTKYRRVKAVLLIPCERTPSMEKDAVNEILRPLVLNNTLVDYSFELHKCYSSSRRSKEGDLVANED